LIEYAKRSELAKKENVNANSNDEDNLDNILFDKKKSMNLKNISKNIVKIATILVYSFSLLNNIFTFYFTLFT